MAIDPRVEELVSLRHAARLLPERRRGKRPHVSCLYRWTTAGCRGVVLESVMVGGTRCTSREALARFIARLSAGGRPGDGGPSLPAPSADRVEAELDAEGIA
jgi:hypothetical protein